MYMYSSLQGSYSSKVREVVRCLKRIERDEPGCKALVFSTWQSLLDVVAQALSDNNITYRHLNSHKHNTKYEQSLNRYVTNIYWPESYVSFVKMWSSFKAIL